MVSTPGVVFFTMMCLLIIACLLGWQESDKITQKFTQYCIEVNTDDQTTVPELRQAEDECNKLVKGE